MAMFLMIIIIISSTLLMAMAKIDDVRNLKDDDCMDIAMRPLPRFGKRSSDLNREIINRVRRSCIIDRRQSKSLSPGWSTLENDENPMETSIPVSIPISIPESNLLQPQQQQQQQPQPQQSLSSSTLFKRFPSFKNLLEQWALQREKEIIYQLINERIQNSRLAKQQQQQQQNNEQQEFEWPKFPYSR
ncbi:uncharacterized protein LOC113795792 [Dermatophagoides pteronyssinus]|uniref:uncharacterized protein LOC113795792 n=1 Tax=Dermatophagoides pteronyssinus TaxID=6956 RepID=UPI003F66AD19